MKHPVAFPSLNENSEAKRNKFQAGVRAYALDYYVPEYVPPTPICSAPFASNHYKVSI